MGGTYIYFFHPKWSKLCTAPLMGPKNPPIKKKLKKYIFEVLFGPFKKGIFCSFYAFPGGTEMLFFHPKWSKLCTAPLKDPKNSHFLKKFKKNIFDLLFGPFKNATFLLILRFYRGYVNTFLFIQNGANFAQPPLLWILRTTLFLKNLKKLFLPPI